MRGLDISDAKFTRGNKAEHINLARKLVNLPRLTNPAFCLFRFFADGFLSGLRAFVLNLRAKAARLPKCLQTKRLGRLKFGRKFIGAEVL